MKFLLPFLLLLAGRALAQAPADSFVPAGEIDPAQEKTMTGLWYRDLPKNQRAVKWYGYGHVSVTIFDIRTNDVLQHQEATWINRDNRSVERICHTDAGFKNIKGKLISYRVEMADAATLKMIYDNGSSEVWHRMPTPK